MNTKSVWEKVSTPVNYPALDKDIQSDVLIIGAGITGMTAALELAKAGLKVMVVESHRVGCGTTGYSTGNLYVPVQPYYQNIKTKFNLETVRIIAHSRKEALNYIERNVNEHQIDCHFFRRPDYLFTKKGREEFLDKEVETLKEAGIDIEYTNELPFPAEATRIAYMPNQARFNPKMYIDGLAKALTMAGGTIFEQTEIIDTEELKDHCIARTDNHKITAKYMIMATHTPKGIHKVQMLAAPYRSYVVAATLANGKYPNGHFWDVGKDGYISSTHSVRGKDLDMLMVAGEHHKTGQANHADSTHYYKKIENYIRSHFEVDSILHQWSAQHYQAADGIPYIGLAHHDSKKSYIAGGYFADGLTYGTVAGIVLTDLIRNKSNPWAKTYDPNRLTPLASAGKFIKENINVLGEYLADLPGHHDATLFSKIKANAGGIVEIKGEKFAAYRDETQELHVVSAVCTHMKCIVQFNNAEKSWDCPCHGSRFGLDGNVLEGPAWRALPKCEVKA
jgi:glycine/D-amino acid oxidase-like deaminating enzyme/nitrite reductase/ring-hydroxylating ferredoxin subunit